MEWHDTHEKFTSVQSLSNQLQDSFKDQLPSTDYDIGYIAKRGNAKRWIICDADIESLYT